MTRHDLDTSAAAKLLDDEFVSATLAEWADAPDTQVVTTHLLETELDGLE